MEEYSKITEMIKRFMIYLNKKGGWKLMSDVKKAVQDFYADDYSWCYGCGRLNEEGLHLRTGWDGDNTITIYEPRPEHKAIPGFIYGGLIASLVDCHGTGSASAALHKKNGHELGDGMEPPRFVTASLHVDYLKPTPEIGRASCRERDDIKDHEE